MIVKRISKNDIEKISYNTLMHDVPKKSGIFSKSNAARFLKCV